MSNSTGEKPAFHIGLAMAGAVSAGAYSAGVFDFLIEALSEWQKAKARGDDVLKHDVFISAISGTSAGGITAALGLASLAGGVRSIETPPTNPNQTRPVRRALPELYDVWVKNTKLFGGRDEAKQAGPANGYRSLLDIGDLQPGKLPASLLNSEMLTRTARATLSSIRPTGVRFSFFTNPTHLFLTHTNLDGIPYPIAFESERSVYWMNLHEDRAHFAVTGLGERPFPEKECRWLADWKDSGDEINVADISKKAHTPINRYRSVCSRLLLRPL
jgi:predicted acylesterase/phospholipase RssA